MKVFFTGDAFQAARGLMIGEAQLPMRDRKPLRREP